MSAFATADEFEKHNPLVRFSFYAKGRVQVLLKLGVEILGELEAAFPDDSSVSFEHLARAEELSWLWILGAYEVVRTMCQAKPCFSERAHKSLSNLKRELGRVRMPAAKMEAQGQSVPIESSRSAAGLSASERDLLVGDPSNPKSLRNLVVAFYSVFSQIDGSDILATHESVYGDVKANPAVHRTLRDKAAQRR